jgi:hypothetical protein
MLLCGQWDTFIFQNVTVWSKWDTFIFQNDYSVVNDDSHSIVMSCLFDIFFPMPLHNFYWLALSWMLASFFFEKPQVHLKFTHADIIIASTHSHYLLKIPAMELRDRWSHSWCFTKDGDVPSYFWEIYSDIKGVLSSLSWGWPSSLPCSHGLILFGYSYFHFDEPNEI